VRITPTRRVYILGASLFVALAFCSRNFGDRGGPHFMISMTLAGVLYLLAVREFFAAPTLPRHVVVYGLIVAAAWHAAFLRLPSGADDDIHRYVWDGRLQRLGYNPYLVVPSDPAAQKLHTAETRNLNNPELPSPYPPGAQLFFRGVTAIQESTFALRLAFAGCEVAIGIVLLDLLRHSRRAHLVLVYAWSPMLATEVAGSGHIDIVGVFLVVLSAAALARKWRATAAVGLGLAIAVKFLPVVLLPLYWKRIRIRDAVLTAAVVGLLYLPFLDHGRIPIGSLGSYVQGFRFNGPLFSALDGLASPQLLVGLAVLAGLVTATWVRCTMRKQSLEAFAWPMAASLLCAPVVFPWYILWLLPFLMSASMLPLIVWTVSIIPTYVAWHMRTLGRPWSLPAWAMIVEYGSLAIASAMFVGYGLLRPKSIDSNRLDP
jgi:alpha-1,6-mannosyltransferase